MSERAGRDAASSPPSRPSKPGIPRERAPTSSRRPADNDGRPLATAARGTRRLATAASRRVGRGGQSAARGFRRAVNARGAGESGLGRVLELHLISTAADTLVVTALAGTIFFAVSAEAARGRVATSLAVTMVPFVLLAPLIGPLLDRVPHGRRYALAATMIVRSFLAWVMADAVAGSADQASFSLYPAACGFLVCQKAYLVTRAAAVPRVLPRDTELVAANSRLSLAGVVAMTVAAPVGAGLTGTLGAVWTLKVAFAVFAGGTALALILPSRIDSAAGEGRAQLGRGPGEMPDAAVPSPAASKSAASTSAPSMAAPRRSRPGLGWRGVLALRGNTVLRAFTGFLTLFLAFRLRAHPVGGLASGTAVALVIAVFGIGGGVGTALGWLVQRLRPEVVVVAVLALAAIVSGWAALSYGLWTVLVVSFVAGLAQSLAKLCLDALIQRDVPETVRTSAFARSETVLQLAWVAGGGLGLIAPLSGPWGLGMAAVLTAASAAGAVISARSARRRRRRVRLLG